MTEATDNGNCLRTELPDEHDPGTDRALDGMLRELARGPADDDEVFLELVFSKTRAVGADSVVASRSTNGSVVGLWLYRVAAVYAVFCVVYGLVQMVQTTVAGTRRTVRRELNYQRIEGEVLGTYLADRFPGTRVSVLVADDDSPSAPRSCALLAGLRIGFGDRMASVNVLQTEDFMDAPAATVAPALSAAEPGCSVTMTLQQILATWRTAGGADNDLVVSTLAIPLDVPVDVDRAGVSATVPATPTLALASGMLTGLESVIRGGSIAAAVTYRPDATWSPGPPPENVDEAFDSRFILVTPENVHEIGAKHAFVFARRE